MSPTTNKNSPLTPNPLTNEELTDDKDEVTYILTTTFLNPYAVIAILAILLFICGALYLGGSSTPDPYGSNYGSDSESSPNIGKTIASILSVIVGILFVLLSVASIAQYIFKIDVVTSISKLFSDTPEIEIQVTKNPSSRKTPALKLSQEVFNIPGNYFGYEDAKAICSAHDSRLATYQEVEQSYNSGAEWCNYGWSDGQMALYPTQQTTWDGLQKIEGHENDCGRPGVNGGYMQNPSTKFGVNCFGYKPKMTSVEEDIMANTSPYPKTKKDIAMEMRVEFWKKRINDILVSPFNYKNWSKL
jgi:hypothetical protein